MADGAGITDYLEAGLRAAGLRGRVIAHNVANLETPGFRRAEVRFEEMLARAMKQGGDERIDLAEVVAQVIRPRSTPLDARGNDVNLDLEVGEMIKNGARYKTYVRILNRLYDQMEAAMRDRV